MQTWINNAEGLVHLLFLGMYMLVEVAVIVFGTIATVMYAIMFFLWCAHQINRMVIADIVHPENYT